MADTTVLISNSPLILLALGFLLGIKHATDADHVAAVSTLVVRTRRVSSASGLGALWGIGHTLTLLLAGIFVLILKLSIPKGLILVAELMVGVVLIVLATMVLRDLRKRGLLLHRHFHRHSEIEHRHIHLHLFDRDTSNHGHHHRSKAFALGILHGMAGSGVFTLMVLGSIDSLLLGLVYILIFGAGSIMGMILLSGLIGLPVKLGIQRDSPYLLLAVNITAATFSLLIGISLIKETLTSL